MTPFWAFAVLCQPCLDHRDRERAATNLGHVREYPGSTPLCDHCQAGQEDPMWAR